MPPYLAAVISKHVAFIISGSAAIFYVVSLLRSPIGDFAPVGLSAFAIVAGLAGVCYTQAPALDSQKEKVTPLYAAEKFLHSSVLLLQALFLKYAETGILKFVDAIPWLQRSVELLFLPLFFATGVFAFFFFTYGFDELNVFLWDRYLQRRNSMKTRQRLPKRTARKQLLWQEESQMCYAVRLVMALIVICVSMKTAVAADSWTLWTKTEMFALDRAGKKNRVDTFWSPAGQTKESSSFSTKSQCDAQRQSTISKFRASQGTKDVADGKRTIQVKDETILLIAQYSDGKGDSEQHIELLCRNEDPPKGARQTR